MSGYLSDLPGGDGVDAAIVGTHFGAEFSGTDIRGAMRRTVVATVQFSTPT